MTETEKASIPVGKIPSGLFIVTTIYKNISEGFLGSWVQQVSFNPLMISIAIQPGRPCHEAILDQGKFCLNIVGEGQNDLMKNFFGSIPEDGPFIGLATEESSHGLILSDSMGYLFCELKEKISPGDHDIVLAEVVGGNYPDNKSKPFVHIRNSGMQY